jgi:diaminopimelate decarboxylase
MPETPVAPNQSLRPLTAARTPAGRLLIGGCDTVALAKEFGTPLYVLDEATIRVACRAYVDALKRHYPPGGRVLYASKALAVMALMALVHQEGLGLRCQSSENYEGRARCGHVSPFIVSILFTVFQLSP